MGNPFFPKLPLFKKKLAPWTGPLVAFMMGPAKSTLSQDDKASFPNTYENIDICVRFLWQISSASSGSFLKHI